MQLIIENLIAKRVPKKLSISLIITSKDGTVNISCKLLVNHPQYSEITPPTRLTKVSEDKTIFFILFALQCSAEYCSGS